MLFADNWGVFGGMLEVSIVKNLGRSIRENYFKINLETFKSLLKTL